MVGLTILGIIVLIIIAVCLIPVGVDVDFTNEKLTVSAKICGIMVQVFPRKPKPKVQKDDTEEQSKKETEAPATQEDQPVKKKRQLPLNMNLDEILGLIKAVLKGLGRFRKTVVDRFNLNIIVAGSDPYKAAIKYGKLNSLLSSLAPLCTANLTVKKSNVCTNVDFLADFSKVDFGLALSIRIGQIFGILNTILFGALKILIKNRLRVRKLKKLENMNETSSQSDQNTSVIEVNTDQINELQEDERNTDNGQN